MSTPPIRIPITADDQYSAVLSTAQARVREFGGISGAAGEQMTRSFHEAKGAAALLGEEVGVKLNRHLRGILATSEVLGPLLEAAFPIVAAIGFIEVAKGIYEKITGIKKLEEDLAASHEWQKHAQEVYKQYVEINRQVQLIGRSEEEQARLKQRFAAEDRGQLEQYRKQLTDEIALLDERGRVQNKVIGKAFGRGAGTAGIAVTQDVGGLSDEDAERQKKLIAEVHNIDLELSLKKVQIVKDGAEAGNAAHKSLLEQLKEENKEADKFWQTWIKLNDEIEKGVRELQSGALGGRSTSSIQKQFAPWLDPKLAPPSGSPLRTDQTELLKLQNDLNESWSKARQILDQIETPAEKYRVILSELKELLTEGRINQQQFNEALAQAKQKYNETYVAMKEFGKAGGDALKQGILMGRSWQDVLKSLLVTLGQLILRMTILKALQSSSFGQSGFGSLLTGLVEGLSGKAGGGPVSAGMPYLVGEQGPELFWPNTSGSIVPNGKFGGGGGQVVYQDFRGAVVTDDLLRRAEGAAMMSSAVAHAVAITRDNVLRGRG